MFRGMWSKFHEVLGYEHIPVRDAEQETCLQLQRTPRLNAEYGIRASSLNLSDRAEASPSPLQHGAKR